MVGVSVYATKRDVEGLEEVEVKWYLIGLEKNTKGVNVNVRRHVDSVYIGKEQFQKEEYTQEMVGVNILDYVVVLMDLVNVGFVNFVIINIKG